MNLLTWLLAVICLLSIGTAEGNRLRRKQNSPLATLQRLSPTIFGRSELTGEEKDPTTSNSPITDGTVTSTKPVTKPTSKPTTEIPRHEDNLGIAKFLDMIDRVDKIIDSLNI